MGQASDSVVERLDGGAPDADAGVGEPVVDAGEGHAGHADQGRLLDLRRVCQPEVESSRAEAQGIGTAESVAAKAKMKGAERGLIWVVEVLDEPVLEDGQRFGAEVAFLPPVETRYFVRSIS